MDDLVNDWSHGEAFLSRFRAIKHFRCKESYVKNFAKKSIAKDAEPHSNIKELPKRLRQTNKPPRGGGKFIWKDFHDIFKKSYNRARAKRAERHCSSTSNTCTDELCTLDRE